MKEFISPILEFVKGIVDRYGVKSLVAGGAIYLIYDLAQKAVVSGLIAVIGICVVVLGYFLIRHIETINKAKNGG